MAKADGSVSTTSPLAELLQEAGLTKSQISKRLGTHRIAIITMVPAAYFPMSYLEKTSGAPFQAALTKLITSGRLRVQDDGEGLILFEPIEKGRPIFVETT